MAVSIRGLKSETVAQGLVASCAILQVSPAVLFSPENPLALKPRRLTAAALLAGWPRKGPRDGAVGAIAELLGVQKVDLAPSGSAAAFSSDQLLTVFEAMRAAGLDPATLGTVRTVAPRQIKIDPAPVVKAPRSPAPATPKAPAAPAAPAVPCRLRSVHTSVAMGRPMSANLRRWTRQFLAAGWSPREVAHLFDLRAAQLAATQAGGGHD